MCRSTQSPCKSYITLKMKFNTEIPNVYSAGGSTAEWDRVISRISYFWGFLFINQKFYIIQHLPNEYFVCHETVSFLRCSIYEAVEQSSMKFSKL